MITVQVNGESAELPDGTTVRSLLELKDLAGGICAVEVNREVVRRAVHETHTLAEGDTVEIVTLVGGG